MTRNLPSLRRGALAALLALSVSVTAMALPAHAEEADAPGGNADPVIAAAPVLAAHATITQVGSQDPTQAPTLNYDNETVAVAQGNYIDVRLSLSGGGAAEGASVATLSCTYKDHDAQRKGGRPTDTLTADVKDRGNNTYRITFAEGVVVDLASLSLTAQPAGDVASVPVTISFAADLPAPVPNAIATTSAHPASKPSVQLSRSNNDWKPLGGDDYARDLGGNAKLSDITFTTTSTDPLFRLFLSDANRAEYPKLSVKAPDGTELQAKPDLNTLTYKNGVWSVSWTLAPPEGTPDVASEGRYQVSVAPGTYYGAQGTHDMGLVVDHTPPTIALADGWSLSGTPLQGNLLRVGNGYEVRLKVTDPNAGVDASTVKMTVKRTDDDGREDPNYSRGARADGDVYAFTFSDTGVYDIMDATVSVSDRLGHSAQKSLRELLKDQPENLKLLVMGENYHPGGESLTIGDADGAPEATDNHHRGGVTVAASVRAPFAHYANVEELHGTLKATVTYANGSQEDVVLLENVTLKQRGTDGADRQWFDLATTDLKSGDQPLVEGHYTNVRLEYTDEPYERTRTLRADDFYVDRTAPAVSNVQVSPQPTVMWGHAFASSAVTIHMDATDAVSGVDWSSLKLTKADGTPIEGVQVEHDEAGPDGTPSNGITITLPNDGQTLDLASTYLHLKDLAGNPLVDPSDSSIEGLSLSGLLTGDGKPLAQDTADIVVDTTAPVVSVSYDNNDARGSYYNKARTATITVVEGSFSYIRDNDANRVIATIGTDGTTHDVTARQFENPSGDGVTWVYTEELSQDGDWTVDASLTDPAGHASKKVHDAFTIDTLAPMVTVEFDNNDAHSGLYFNRPRTATITVRERNFDPSLMGVSTSAKDASGNAADAPGASGWSATGEEDTWSCTVHFGGEYHYGLSVSGADPAGNQTEAYEVPEFVIDMTPPQASVEHVENKTAYAGEVAPSLSMSDTNLSIGNSKYSLTGAHSGKVDYMRGMETSYSETSESVTYADFEHKVERDDVYTLTVHAEDLAGNASDVTRVFSVNRYGSNYLYSDATASILGAYLKAPQDVVITEINVSGLDDDGTHVELAHDSEVTDLVEDESYTAEVSDDSGWSKTTYTIPASNFSRDGYYRVMMTSHDKAGNLAQNTMGNKDATRKHAAEVNFAVDATAPVVGFAGADTGGVYFGASHDALPLASDNLALDHVTLQVDGGEPEELSPDEFAGGPASLEIPADAKLHTLTIAAYDKAGNVRSTTLGSVAVAPNWVEYLKANPNMLFALVAFVVMALGLGAMGIVLVVRHHRATEGLRNPFGR